MQKPDPPHCPCSGPSLSPSLLTKLAIEFPGSEFSHTPKGGPSCVCKLCSLWLLVKTWSRLVRIFLSVQCLANSLASSVILSLASANALAHAISSRFVPFPPRISSLGYRGQMNVRIRKINLIWSKVTSGGPSSRQFSWPLQWSRCPCGPTASPS